MDFAALSAAKDTNQDSKESVDFINSYILTFKMASVLGISSGFHDASCCLVHSNKSYLQQEERFSRVKKLLFSRTLLKLYCRKFKAELEDIEAICFFERPLLRYKNMTVSNLETLRKDFWTYQRNGLTQSKLSLKCVQSH